MTDRHRRRRESARGALSLMLLGVLLLGAGAVLGAGAGPRVVADDLGTVPAAAGSAATSPAGATGGAPLRPVPAARVLPVLAPPDVAAGGSPDGAALPGAAAPAPDPAAAPDSAAAPDPGAAPSMAAAPDPAAVPDPAATPDSAAAPETVGPGTPAWRPGDLRPGAPATPSGAGPQATTAPGGPPAAPGGPQAAPRITGPATLAAKLPWTVSPIYPLPVGVDPAAPNQPVFPATLELPDRDVVAPVEPVGTGPNGGMVVPERVRTVGWWAPGVLPGGSTGSAVIAGHVDSATRGVGVLAVLPQLAAGEPVVVRSADGRATTFRVVARREYGKRDLPPEVFRRDGDPQLVLITCGGAFDPAAGSYESNIVVYAVPDTT